MKSAIQFGQKDNKTFPSSSYFLNLILVLFITTVWISAGLFALYILAFYFASFYNGNLEQWNKGIPGLFVNGSPANTGIALHFIAGGFILLLGSIQLMDKVRLRFPSFHRWVGRVYLVCCLIASLGGLIFIMVNGTIGHTIMNIGFFGYGVLMLIATLETYNYAVKGRIDHHRAWAIRLYALAIGSWLFRIEYGFWIMLTNGLGTNNSFSGIFDKVMPFFFYLPNLLVAEIFIRRKKTKFNRFINLLSSAGLMVLTLSLWIGTFYFTKFIWGPAIIKWFRIAN